MKVVLFCGGLGTRLREYSQDVPKPMVKLGYRPVLWHVMRYYAHFGHRDFVLCLGYRADAIKSYFLNYDECITNDFTLVGGREVKLAQSDIADWNISFVDTGTYASIGERLQRVRAWLDGEEYFLANYTDGLTDLDLPEMIDTVKRSGKVAGFVCARPSQTFHVVNVNDSGQVDTIRTVRDTGLLINGGYFVFNRRIFDYMKEGEDLVGAPFERLIAEGQLYGYKYERFWCMDTFKEQQELSDMCASGRGPWEVWKS